MKMQRVEQEYQIGEMREYIQTKRKRKREVQIMYKKRKLKDDVQTFKKETKNTEYTKETTGGTRQKRTREESCEYYSRKERICYWCGHEGEEKKTQAPSEWEHMDYQRTLLRIMKQEEEECKGENSKKKMADYKIEWEETRQLNECEKCHFEHHFISMEERSYKQQATNKGKCKVCNTGKEMMRTREYDEAWPTCPEMKRCHECGSLAHLKCQSKMEKATRPGWKDDYEEVNTCETCQKKEKE